MPNTAGQRAEAHRRYYQACIRRWSDERYALDKRFVQLTLLLDQGEDAPGPRWQSAREQYHDLSEVLAQVPEQTVVLLGPPGSGKSTLLRHYELDGASAALTGSAGADISTAPLTFFVSLHDYKPAHGSTLLPPPLDWLAAQWENRYPDLPGLDTLLRERRLTLLLDALNEIPYAGPEPVRLWRYFLRELERDYRGNRVVFSCRRLDYSELLSSSEHPVPQVRFVRLYCPEHGEVAADYGLRPEAKVIKMAQVRLARTGLVRQVRRAYRPTRCLLAHALRPLTWLSSSRPVNGLAQLP